MKVLNKHLNFCPTPGYYNRKKVKPDIKNFERKIKLKSFFELKKQDKPNENNNMSSDILNIKPLTRSQKLLKMMGINFSNRNKLYKVITSHKMKRAL